MSPPEPERTAAHPRRDAALVASFMLTLLLCALVDPLGGRRAHVENRALAAWPALAPARDAFARFDAAFSDRFAGRNALIALQHAITVLGFRSSPVSTVMIGRDDWLYFAGEDGHSIDRHYRGTIAVTDADIAALVAELERRREFLAGLSIAHVVTIVPDKFSIYPDHLPRWVQRMPGPTPLDRASAALAAAPGMRYVDLRPVLRAAAGREPAYYRTDSHWNYLGASAGYAAIMQAVQSAVGPARLPAIAPAERPPYAPGVDVYRGDLAQILGVRRRYEEPDIAPLGRVLGDASRRCARRIDDARDPGFEIYACASAPPLRAIVLRDSMAIPLIPMLSENFQRVVYVAGRHLDPALVRRERPDVVIEEFVERNLHATAQAPMPVP